MLALWRQVFSHSEQHPVKFDWCYAGETEGKGRLYLLDSSGQAQPIGVQGIVVRRWWLLGQAVDAGICADLVVDQQHRSIGPALMLVAGAMEQELQTHHLKLLYAFPNRKSEALYRRKAYPRLKDISRYAKPLRSQVWLRRKGIPRVLAASAGVLIDSFARLRQLPHGLRDGRCGRLASVTKFDARFDVLWARVRDSRRPMAIRDAAFLQWRFGNHFARETQIMVMDIGQGQIDGYIVYTIHENRIAGILDFLASDDNQVLTAMLRQFVAAMRQRAVDGISLEFCGPSAVDRCLRQLGFLVRESSPVFLLIGQQTLNPENTDRIYLTACDRDQ